MEERRDARLSDSHRSSPRFRAGDWVEVRSKEEILETLDRNGRLEALPFMPEMFQYCGRRLRVWKRAHKTCDTVNSPSQGRRMASAVHLEGGRCDGKAHGGCGAECLIFWKEAWLKPLDAQGKLDKMVERVVRVGDRQRFDLSRCGGCTEQDISIATRAPGDEDDQDPTYVCQATLLPEATTRLSWWDFTQYLEDVTSGNVEIPQLLKGGVYASLYQIIRRSDRSRIHLSPFLIRWYDRWQSLVGGVPYPRKRGTIPAGEKTPSP